MAFRSSAVAINTSTATKLFTAVAGDVEAWICSSSAGNMVAVCGPSTSFGNSIMIPSNGPFNVRIRPGDELWAYATTSSQSAVVLIRSA